MVQGKNKIVSYKVHDQVQVPESEWIIKENTHEPTFTQEEYDILTNLFRRDTRTANTERKVYLFSGFLKCYDCKKALHRTIGKGRVYYQCPTYKSKSKTKCTKHTIRADNLETAVLAIVQSQIALIESLANIVDEINNAPVVETQSARIEKLLAEKRKELLKTKQLSDGLYIDWKRDEIDHEDYRRMKMRFSEQSQAIKANIEKLEEELLKAGQGVTTDEKVFKEFLQYKNIQKLERNILVELVDIIYIHENKEVTVKFRYEDELARISEYVEINRENTDVTKSQNFFACSLE
jgi:hypothetical protein